MWGTTIILYVPSLLSKRRKTHKHDPDTDGYYKWRALTSTRIRSLAEFHTNIVAHIYTVRYIRR